MEEGSKGERENKGRRKKKKKQKLLETGIEVAVKGWGGVRQFNGYIVLFLQTQKILEARNTTM